MSTTSQLRHERGRRVYPKRFTLLVVFTCLLTFLWAHSDTLAQNASVGKSDISKSTATTSVWAQEAALRDAYRANYPSKITRQDLDLFLHRSNGRARGVTPTSGFSRSLSKGSSSVLDDMQLIPDQTFENSQGYGAPDLITLPDDVIGIVYSDRGIGSSEWLGTPVVGPRILFRTSSDSGATWTDPIVVGDHADYDTDYQWVSIAMTAGGRLVVIDESPNFGQVNGSNNHLFYSDDLGTTWTEAAYEETDFLDWVLGPVNGKLWVQGGTSPQDGQTSVQVITSDDGMTWSAPQTIIASIPAQSDEVDLSSVVSTGDSDYLAATTIWSTSGRSIGLSSSSDNGATWSTIQVLDTGQSDVYDPTLSVGGDGTVYLSFASAFFTGSYLDQNIYTAMSTDGGATFSTPVQLTRYVGGDFNPAQSMAGSVPLIAFRSDRGTENQRLRIWYGLGGADPTPDLNPPPIMDFADYPGGWFPGNRTFPAPQLVVHDESGVSSAQYRVMQDGKESTVPLFDDGQHNDGGAGDGIFGGTMGPIPYGSNLQILGEATDDGGNSGYGYAMTMKVAALHDVGNLVAAVTSEGAMGSYPVGDNDQASFKYPKDGGFNFMSYAGLWVGLDKTPPGKRVSHLFYDNVDGPNGTDPALGDWQVTEYPSEGPGESEDDIVMHYDDSGGVNPIGLGVQQTTYQWSDASYIIFDYEITNESGGDLTNLYAAMAADPDVPREGASDDDVIGYDAGRALIYAQDTGDWCQQNDPQVCTATNIGVALIDDGLGKAAPVPYTATRWNQSADPSRPGNGLDANMYNLMTSGIWSGFDLGFKTSTDDWRVVLTAQPFDLAAGESKRIVFGFVAGADEDGIKANTDAMVARYQQAVLATELTDPVPHAFALKQNYPNPFNPSTTIPFSVESASQVTLTVFDVLGREVDRIVDERLSAGSYTATFESNSLPSGAYYYTLTADGKSITKSMFLLK